MSLDCDLDLIKFTLSETRKKLNDEVLNNKEKEKKICEYKERIENLCNEFKEQKYMYEKKISNLENLLKVQNVVD